MSVPILAASIAILSGIGIGIALQRGRGCTNSAFRNLLLIRNGELSSMIVVIVAVELIGYYFLSLNPIPGFTFIENPISFSLLFIPLGGFLFGLGMPIAGGCAGGTCYRVGEGKLTSVLALFGFATGIAIIAASPLTPAIDSIRVETEWTLNGSVPSLSQLLPRWFWTIIAVIVLATTVSSYFKRRQEGATQLTHLLPFWNPITTGVIVGILGVIARYGSGLSGRQFGLSTTDGIAQVVQLLILFQPIGWAGLFIISLILGSAIVAILGKEFEIRMPPRREAFRFLSGGTLLGIGAMLGYGCNFGHIFGGLPELGISSVVSLFFMLFGNYFSSYLMYIRFGREFPESTPIPT